MNSPCGTVWVLNQASCVHLQLLTTVSHIIATFEMLILVQQNFLRETSPHANVCQCTARALPDISHSVFTAGKGTSMLTDLFECLIIKHATERPSFFEEYTLYPKILSSYIKDSPR